MRILHMIPDIGIANGVMSVILNYAKAMPDDVYFDVVYFEEKPETKQKEIESLGGRVFKIKRPSLKSLFSGDIKNLLNEHKGEWQALHIHAPHFAVFIAPYAKKAGIKKICCQCHSTWYSLVSKNDSRNKLLYQIGKPFLDKQFACGRDAGLFWYKNEQNFEVLNNAIDCSKYSFDSEKRDEIRSREGLSDKLVIGNIGRTKPPQKNHPFILEVFSEIVKKNENSVLLLAGAQPDNELLEFCRKYGIEDKVKFLGMRKDIFDLLQAFDLLLFPSFKEGLPVSVVEAQAAGLPVLMSDTITDEVSIHNCFSFSLSASAEEWAEKALELSALPRENTFQIMQSSGWDINDCAKKLLDYYED